MAKSSGFASVARMIPRQDPGPLSREALDDVVAHAWKQVLGIDLRSLARVATTNDIAVSAALPLFGASALVVVVRTSAEVAAQAAVSVLGLQADELAPGDIEDAFAGIVGAVGIGLLEAVPEILRLGTPVVVQGQSLRSAVPGASLMCETTLRSEPGPVHVGLWRPRLQRVD